MAQSSDGITARGGVTALRGTLVSCMDDPFLTDAAKAFTVERDGIMICRDGKIEAVGPASDLLAGVPQAALLDYSGCLIAPGFIDTHVHYVQTGMVASYGTQLLDWLDRYAFPAELEFADAAHAAAMAKIFCAELLRNGTTTAPQLDAAGTLWREHPDVLVQTHIAENRREIEWTAELFPQAKNYLDIYDQHGLIGRRAVLAHGIHLGEDELCRCHESGTA